MKRRLSRTWSLMKSGFRVLFSDLEILVFPLISGLACLVLLATFAAPVYLSQIWGLAHSSRETEQKILFGVCWFTSYVALYFVMIFFNTAMVACALIRMGGGNPTIGDGLKAALSRGPSIFGWALLSATVGLVLKAIEARWKRIGEIVASLLGCAWTMASFLVVPVLVMERKGPIASFKESTKLLSNTWGEQLIGNLSFGILFFLLNIPGVLALIGGALVGTHYQSWPLLWLGLGSAVLWFGLVALTQSAIHCIYQAAVYLYAREGRVPQGFEPEAFGESHLQQAA